MENVIDLTILISLCLIFAYFYIKDIAPSSSRTLRNAVLFAFTIILMLVISEMSARRHQKAIDINPVYKEKLQ